MICGEWQELLHCFSKDLYALSDYAVLKTRQHMDGKNNRIFISNENGPDDEVEFNFKDLCIKRNIIKMRFSILPNHCS